MTPERVDVVVVGAGIAGLSAVVDLRAAGLRVQCLEPRDRVGGRLLSAPAEGGGRLDLGASWFWQGEHRVAALVERLGVQTHAQHLAGDAVHDYPQGVRPMHGNPVAYRRSASAGARKCWSRRSPLGCLRARCG